MGCNRLRVRVSSGGRQRGSCRPGKVLKMFSHLLRESTKPNAGEIINRETCVARIFHREYPFKTGTKDFILKSFLQLPYTKMLP